MNAINGYHSAMGNLCHQFLQYFILHQLWKVPFSVTFITMCWSRQYVFNLVRHPTPEKTNFNFLFTSGIRTWDPYQNPDRTHALNCSAMAPLVHKKSYNTKKFKFMLLIFINSYFVWVEVMERIWKHVWILFFLFPLAYSRGLGPLW